MKKTSTIQFDSFKKETSAYLRCYYVIDGRFDWILNDQHYILYPGDFAIVLPGQNFGGEKDLLEIGTVAWLHLDLQHLGNSGKLVIGPWSRLTENECATIGRIFIVE